MADQTVRVRLEANIASYQAAMGAAMLSTKQLGREMSGLGDTGKKDLTQLGTGAMVAGGAMLAGFGIAAGAAMNFDAVISDLGAVSGATAGELDQLRQQALDAGAATVFSASEAATAQAELAKAGVSTADILGGGLDGALDLAAAGQLDLAKASELSANAMTSFGLKGSDVTRIADTLAAGANKSASTVEGMGLSLQQTSLVADQLGISLEETVGGLSMFAQAGLKGSDAGTSMKTMLQRFNPVSDEAAGLMKELNIDFFDAQGNFVGLEQAAGELQTGMANLTQEQRASALQTIFGQDAIRAATDLYEGGAAGVAEWTGKVTDSGYAAELAAKKTDNLKGDLEQLKGSIETTLINGGTEANGVLRFLTQSTTDLVNGMGALPGPVAAVGMGLTAVTGAGLLAVGAAGTMIPKFREVMSTLEGMGPGGQRAAAGIQKVGAAAGAAAIAVGGVTLAWSMWSSEIDKVVNNGLNAVDGVLAGTTTLEGYKRQMAEVGNQASIAEGQVGNFWMTSAADQDAREETRQFAEGLGALQIVMGYVTVQAEQLAAATGDNADKILVWLEAQRQAGTVYGSTQEALDAYQHALATGAVQLTEVSDATAIAERETIDFKKALDDLLSSLFGMEEGRDALQRGLNELPGVLLEVAGNFNGTSEAALAYREHMRGMAEDAVGVIEQTEAQIGQGPELEAAIRFQIAALVDQAVAQGVSREEAEKYFGRLLEIKGLGAVSTDVNVNTENALYKVGLLIGGLDALIARMQALGGGVMTVADPGVGLGTGITRLRGAAHGGDVRANSMVEVNEMGPEMFSSGGRDYLMTGSSGGTVTPHHQTMAAMASAAGGSSRAGDIFDIDIHLPAYMGNPAEVVEALKWPIIDAIGNLQDARAGRDN